ncbi:MAG: hypothetical protein GF401_15975 [Chitinivibrionales bacterium]|nr:hypothetical protein [Chitinivibrionales bacterium]
MISNDLRQIISNLKKKLLLPYLQSLFTVFIYVFVAYYLDKDKTRSIAVQKVLLYVFSTMAALVAIGSVVVPRWFFSSSRITTMLQKEYGPGDWWDNNRIERIVGKNQELMRNLKDDESKICAMLHWTFGYHYIFMALPDMIGIWGLVLSILSQDYRYAVVFCTISFPIKLMSYPRLESIAQESEMQFEKHRIE